MSWTDERVEMLKAMWAEGKSASQIAKELGGVTRNAVIGKVHRLGLSNRTGAEPAPEQSEPSTEPPQAPAPEPRVTQAAPEPEPTPQPAEPEMPTPEPSQSMNGSPAEAVNRPAVAPPFQPRPNRPGSGQPLPPQPAGAEMSEETLANLAEAAKKAKRLSLMQLTERTCKWPVGDPATDDFWFCGLPSAPGKPYCETHVSVAFQPMSSRRDRRSSGGR
ncbi:GcrA family cell cycle regulator [Amaricoccus macauensis]|uniref:GcrA family cell cycle regulator n=1 Tax=Amaricoccus macauensis TaxID=57001 RepID=UPI003C7A8D60